MAISPPITAKIARNVEIPSNATAPRIARGVQRLFGTLGYVSLTEFCLANGRRADVIAIGPKSEIHIVEIKSSLADFRSDSKWPEYREFCDQFSFAVAPEFPLDVLPNNTGLILADAYGGAIECTAQITPLAPARRKAMLLSFAHTSASRLTSILDPANINR